MTDPFPARMSTRKRALVAGVLLIALLGALAAWTGLRSVAAKQHLERARAQLGVARTALLDRRLDEARQAVRGAGVETRRARDLTGDPVTSGLSHLPILGRSLTVVRGIARAADDIATHVLPDALASAQALDPKALRRPDGSVDLTVLARAQPGVVTASARASEVAAAVRSLPSSLLLGAIDGPRAEFVTQTTQLADALRGASDALQVAPGLLGADRPRRWFVLVQQTSESRGTGGLPGGFAILETDKGRLRVPRQGSNADLINSTVAPVGLPKDFTERYGLLGSFDIWQNINVSPDLPVVSRYIVQRWKAQTGQSVDGVIALDAVALADLLQGSGPVQVAPGQRIEPSKIEDYLALGQYAGGGNVNDQTARKEKLTNVARAVITRLTSGGGDSTALLRGLSSAVRSGHIRVATDDPAMAPLLRNSGADGGLPRDGRPFAYPVVFNAAGSKLEYFLDRKVTYVGGPCSGGRRRTTVTVTLRTDPPPLASIPPYVTIRLEDGNATQSLVDRLGLSVYATRGARLVSATLDGKALGATVSPEPFLEAGTEAGLPVWLTYLDLPPRAARVLVLTLDEPSVKGAATVLEQPLARPQASRVDVPSCA